MIQSQTDTIQSRQPLRWRIPAKVAIESKNPRFEVDYSFKKDLDPDEQRQELKALNRQFKREKRAATRELRRDNQFLGQVKFQEQMEAHKERQEERQSNFKWLNAQHEAMNVHVKKEKGFLKGGGSGAMKGRKGKR